MLSPTKMIFNETSGVSNGESAAWRCSFVLVSLLPFAPFQASEGATVTEDSVEAR
jgi:hypothetical protein